MVHLQQHCVLLCCLTAASCTTQTCSPLFCSACSRRHSQTSPSWRLPKKSGSTHHLPLHACSLLLAGVRLMFAVMLCSYAIDVCSQGCIWLCTSSYTWLLNLCGSVKVCEAADACCYLQHAFVSPHCKGCRHACLCSFQGRPRKSNLCAGQRCCVTGARQPRAVLCCKPAVSSCSRL